MGVSISILLLSCWGHSEEGIKATYSCYHVRKEILDARTCGRRRGLSLEANQNASDISANQNAISISANQI